MAILVSIGTFITITLALYGVLYRQVGDGGMEARLGGLRYQRAGREALPDPDAAFKERVIRPFVQGINRRLNSVLPSSMSDRLELALTQGGIKMKPGQFIMIIGILMGTLPVLAALWAVSVGLTGPKMLLVFAGALVLGGYAPRIWLLGRIKRRQKAIWRSLPDAFDLVTASVEAGLGIDAAFARVVDKVEGPFAVELARTMREIQMGRQRRDAFLDLSDRTGVEELRSLINSVVQAEQMGISIGSVIRVQTGVIRTKRRQRAEEQAFKAPIKMVFPLVFFIFPTIMVVIGGPAVIQMMQNF